jgi:hypothetical protein
MNNSSIKLKVESAIAATVKDIETHPRNRFGGTLNDAKIFYKLLPLIIIKEILKVFDSFIIGSVIASVSLIIAMISYGLSNGTLTFTEFAFSSLLSCFTLALAIYFFK